MPVAIITGAGGVIGSEAVDRIVGEFVENGPTAEELDIRRDMPRHLGFASGTHFCIGSHLAKLQARIAVEELYARFPHVGVDVTKGERTRSPFTRGWVSLPATGL